MLKRFTTAVLFFSCLATVWADPSYEEVRQKGDQALKKKDYATAVREFERLVYLYGEKPEAYVALGYACYLDQRYERAILEFKKALNFNPRHAEALNNLMLAVGKRAVQQTQELEFSEAINLLAATERQYPSHPQSVVLHYAQGQLEFFRGNERAGLKDWEQVAQRVPTSGTAKFIEAYKLYAGGRPKQALPAMQAAQAKLPKEPVVRNYLALVLSELGRNKEALAQLQKARQGNPPYIDLFLNQATVLLKTGDLENAQAALVKARDLRPDYASVHLWLAALRRQAGDQEGSKKEVGLALADAAQPAILVSGEVGKSVWVDNDYLGVTPVGAFVKAGKHKLKVTAKGQPAGLSEFTLAADQVAYATTSPIGVETEAASAAVPDQRAARSFALRDQSNKYWRSFQHFHTRPVVLLFWKVGAPDNDKVLNALSDLGNRYGTKIGCAVIHVDTENKNQAIGQMMSLPATYARLFDEGSVTKRYGLTNDLLPSVIVVDLDGYIASQAQGVEGVDKARQVLDGMGLAPPHP
ncbi:MAG: tetratricopeptide repeat protein [Candidatus Eremiobacteraeota bacterium]|nr:tetratricopeptide repeat protein [Candidatus Eremiobacteraeota bacterium]MCW5867883.1 tetratricopeptide repeat protein [Candidatus Eremiobacteraeota bacterium]